MIYDQHPDGWTILKFTTDEEVFYKIFAAWRWGDEEWRLSSGAHNTDNLVEEETKFIWTQASGSIYHLPKGGENCYTFYQGLVLNGLLNKSNKLGASVEIVKLETIRQARWH